MDFRKEFHIPKNQIYFCGNSLGLQPKRTRSFIEQELRDWENLGVEGHLHGKSPWLPYHEQLAPGLEALVGGKPGEVVAMNGLTTNLHLMLTTFYRPNKSRYKILVEENAFPSDFYAVWSQAELHGLDPKEAIVEIKQNDVENEIIRHGESIALVLLGQVNYLTGQAFDLKKLASATHNQGAIFGTDLAHGIGNLELHLNAWGVDFAVWCSYKYLNSGPGGLAGCFVHEKHGNKGLPRCAGWWGHDKASRFDMPKNFKPIPGAEGFQLSNPPIFQAAALKASLEIFNEAGFQNLRKKTLELTKKLRELLEPLPIEVITPLSENSLLIGAQLSLRLPNLDGKAFNNELKKANVICDFREPDVLRVAPVPLYNTLEDILQFVKILEGIKWI